MVSRLRRRAVLPQIRKNWRLSERRACEILAVNRRAVRYRSVRGDADVALRLRIKAIAEVRIRYGQRRIHVLLRREGWNVNIKRVARLYREEGLAIRTKTPRRRRAAVVREAPAQPTAVNPSWAMDFMHDVLADGSKIRLLTIVDIFSRESVALEVDCGFKAPQCPRNRANISTPNARRSRVREFVSKARCCSCIFVRWIVESRCTGSRMDAVRSANYRGLQSRNDRRCAASESPR